MKVAFDIMSWSLKDFVHYIRFLAEKRNYEIKSDDYLWIAMAYKNAQNKIQLFNTIKNIFTLSKNIKSLKCLLRFYPKKQNKLKKLRDKNIRITPLKKWVKQIKSNQS